MHWDDVIHGFLFSSWRNSSSLLNQDLQGKRQKFIVFDPSKTNPSAISNERREKLRVLHRPARTRHGLIGNLGSSNLAAMCYSSITVTCTVSYVLSGPIRVANWENTL